METNVEYSVVKAQKPSLFGIIFSPSIQFQRMIEKSPIGVPLVIMSLIMAVTGALASLISLNNPAVKNLNSASGINIPIGLTVGLTVLLAIIGGIAMFFFSASLYKIFMIFMGNDTPYKKILAIVIYSSIISSIGLLVNSILAISLGSFEQNYTSLVLLAGDNKILKAFTGSFDIFQIWYYIVLAMGLHITAGLSKNKAASLVIIFFVLGMGFNYLMSLIPHAAGM